MKLILTRHAKSSWDDLNINDHDRPLNERGRAAATRMGGWLKGRRHGPSQILSSTATRAQETAALLNEELGDVPVTFSKGLYHASPDAILAQIHRAPPGDLLVVGHNPGIGALAQMILDTAPHHDRFDVYPTTATLICEMPVEAWSEASFNQGRCLDFVVPRELKALNLV